MKFLFDLDGTLTTHETLPLIAKHFGIKGDMATLTKQTVEGYLPFEASFRSRVAMLSHCPVSEVMTLLSTVPVHSRMLLFITERPSQCAIVTSNLDVWCAGLLQRIGCEAFCSESIVEDNSVTSIAKVLRKEEIIDFYHSRGEKVIFIGDGDNDVEAARRADISIASGLTHQPAKRLAALANYTFFREEDLYDCLLRLAQR